MKFPLYLLNMEEFQYLINLKASKMNDGYNLK